MEVMVAMALAAASFAGVMVAMLTPVADSGALDYEAAGRFAADLAAALTSGGLPARCPTAGPLVGLYVGAPGDHLAPAVDYDSAAAVAGNGVYPRLFHAMLRRGVALAPGAYEVLFPGMAHGDRELAQVAAAAAEAAAEVAGELSAA